MATVDKNFKVKHGLVVEGTTATVNGNDILTTASTITTDNVSETTSNRYFTDQRAKDAAASLITNATKTNIVITGDGNGLTITAENGVADSTTDDLTEGTTNKYFTNQRAFDAVETLFQRPMGPGTGINVGTYTGPTGPAEISINRTVVDTWYDASGAATTAESNAKSYTDNLIGDPTVNGTSGNTIKARIDSAVAGLVDGAPALLDTLNELAAAIADNPNYATDMATNLSNKQNTLTAGNGIELDTLGNISAKVDGITISKNATTDGSINVQLGSGLAANTSGIYVDTDTIASKTYVDTNFVNVADLPGQLADYVPLTEKGQALGVATLDAGGDVPATQLGNQFVTAVSTNFAMSGKTLTMVSNPTHTALQLQSHLYLNANTQNMTVSGGEKEITNFYTGEIDAMEIVIKARKSNWTDRHMTKVLITCDGSGNVAMTEYGSIATNQDLFTVTATGETYGPNHLVRIKVTPLQDVNVKWHYEGIGA